MRSSGNDRDREHAGGEHGLGQQHDQAPGRAIRPLRQADDDGERAPDQPRSPVRAGRSPQDIAQVRHGVEDPDQPGRHAEQRREHSHRTRTRHLCTAFPPPPRDDQAARVRRSLGGGATGTEKFKPLGVASASVLCADDDAVVDACRGEVASCAGGDDGCGGRINALSYRRLTPYPSCWGDRRDVHPARTALTILRCCDAGAWVATGVR